MRMDMDKFFDIDIEKAVIENYKNNYQGVSNGKNGLELFLETHLCEDDAGMHLELVRDYIELSGKKILDVGSGFGCFVLAGLKAGYDVCGAEVDKSMVAVSKKRLATGNFNPEIITRSDSLRLPYTDEKFDVVTFFNVLEHVEDIKSLLYESWRVLKRKGKIFIWGPNYFCMYEPHYEMFFLPLLPAPIAKVYLKLRGKKASFYDTLNFAKPPFFEKILRGLDMDVDNAGLAEWKTSVAACSDKYRTPQGVRMLKLIKKMGLSKLAVKMGDLGFYYPLKYVATKK